MKFYILISLYNYFILHNIKYFFLNKINQTIQMGQKHFSGGGQITESITKNYYFSKFKGQDPPLVVLVVAVHRIWRWRPDP
jgi:hypothetical protein